MNWNDWIPTQRTALLGLLILYTSLLSMYTPRSWINLVNQPFIKLACLIGILYVLQQDMTMGIYLAIAFIVTISIDHSIEVAKADLHPVEEIEGFDNLDDEEEEIEIEEENEEEKPKGKRVKHPIEDYDDYVDDQFEHKLSTDKQLNDTFKNLHQAIHQLESFMNHKN